MTRTPPMPGAVIDRPPARLLSLLFVLYVPYSWLVLLPGPFDGYRWHWISLWPVLPGFLVHLSPAVHRLPDWASTLLAGAVTAMIVLLALRLAERCPGAGLVIQPVVGLLSGINAYITCRLYLD